MTPSEQDERAAEEYANGPDFMMKTVCGFNLHDARKESFLSGIHRERTRAAALCVAIEALGDSPIEMFPDALSAWAKLVLATYRGETP
jgi:hypothetical protein